MNSKATELAKLMFGCTECVPGNRAAAAACPACQAVAQHIADCELDGDDYDDEEEATEEAAEEAVDDDEDEEEDDDDDKHNVLDYDPDLTDADYAAHAASIEAVGKKRKATHGDYDLIDMMRRHADELRLCLRKMKQNLAQVKQELSVAEQEREAAQSLLQCAV
jgi:hypothetical protein